MALSSKRYMQTLRAYLEAWDSAEKAAQILEDGSASVSAAGEKFIQPSGSLIGQTEDLCSALKVWVNTFESEAEVEKE